MIGPISARNRSPASVNATLRMVRLNSRTPSRFSSERMVYLIVVGFCLVCIAGSAAWRAPTPRNMSHLVQLPGFARSSAFRH